MISQHILLKLTSLGQRYAKSAQPRSIIRPGRDPVPSGTFFTGALEPNQVHYYMDTPRSQSYNSTHAYTTTLGTPYLEPDVAHTALTITEIASAKHHTVLLSIDRRRCAFLYFCHYYFSTRVQFRLLRTYVFTSSTLRAIMSLRIVRFTIE